MNRWITSLLLVAAFSVSVFADQQRFPQNPNPQLTPGHLCDHPDSYRYPEHIPYCQRDVDGSTKQAVIQQYNSQLGYDIRPNERGQFKIDHLIPLCAGGGNDKTNLWPQHQSVYTITDPLEGLACDKMAAGRLSQKRAIDLLMRAKNHLDEAPSIQKQMEAL